MRKTQINKFLKRYKKLEQQWKIMKYSKEKFQQ